MKKGTALGSVGDKCHRKKGSFLLQDCYFNIWQTIRKGRFGGLQSQALHLTEFHSGGWAAGAPKVPGFRFLKLSEEV
jgi:hypothetical protein